VVCRSNVWGLTEWLVSTVSQCSVRTVVVQELLNSGEIGCRPKVGCCRFGGDARSGIQFGTTKYLLVLRSGGYRTVDSLI
jgi:hypothetical protein